MRKFLFFVITSVYLFLYLNLSLIAENPPRVAVLNFNHDESILKAEAETLTRLFESALIQTGAFVVVKQTSVEVILKTQAFSLKEYTDQNYALRVGQLISANHIFLGNLARLGQKIILDVQLVEVQQGKALQARNMDAPDPEGLAENLEELALSFAPGGKKTVQPEFDKKIKIYITLGDKFLNDAKYTQAQEQYEKALAIEEFNPPVIAKYIDARLQKILAESLYQAHSVADGLDIALRNDYQFIKFIPDKEIDACLEQIMLLKTLQPERENEVSLYLQEVDLNKVAGRVQEALKILNEARKKTPDNPAILAESGLLMAFETYKQKKEPEGLLLLRQAINLEPENPLFHLYLARSLDRDHKKPNPEALREYHKAAELALEDDFKTRRIRMFALQSLQRLYYQLGSFEDGVLTPVLDMGMEERLEHLLFLIANKIPFYSSSDVQNPDFFLANLYFATKKYNEAESTLQGLIEAKPSYWQRNKKWLLLYKNILEKGKHNPSKLKEILSLLKALQS